MGIFYIIGVVVVVIFVAGLSKGFISDYLRTGNVRRSRVMRRAIERRD
jgi:hypothetical protein